MYFGFSLRRCTKAMAETMPSTSSAAASSKGMRYWVYITSPNSRTVSRSGPMGASRPKSAKFVSPLSSTSTSDAVIKTPMDSDSGKLRQKPRLSSSTLMLSIMMTNSTSTITAPM